MKQYQYLIAPGIGWLLAQIIKLSIYYYQKAPTKSIFLSGGMPSSHTTFVASLATIVGWEMGLNSVVFALAAGLTAVVAFDSMNVRRTVGEHGTFIKHLIQHNSKPAVMPSQDIYHSQGHNALEVFAGLILGIAIGTGVYFIL